jgi:alkylation response protein AidB-like acyl-CoA dehydrogenase
MVAQSTLMDSVDAVGPLLATNARASEKLGKLTPESFDAMEEEGIFRLWVPTEFGGIESGIVESIRIIERLSYHDGAAGWVAMATRASTALSASLLPDDGASDVFGAESSIVAGQGAPNGKAQLVDGGYLLNGRWNYGSGSMHADFIMSGGFVFKDGARITKSDGSPESRMFVVPRAQVTLEGNWDVLGLQATGSVDYSMTDLFVPVSHTFAPASKALRGNVVHRLGLPGFTAIGHTAFALGTARHALDEIIGVYTARAERRPAGPAAQVDLAAFSLGYGDAEAKFRAARSLVYDTWGEIERTIEAGDDFSTRHLTLARLALNYVTTVAVENCEFAYKVGGGNALRESNIQRCYREMLVGAQHLLTSPDILRECGRDLAGFAKNEVWQGAALVPAR